MENPSKRSDASTGKPGRPKATDKRKPVKIPVDSKEHAILAGKAASEGLALATWCRRELLKAAK